MDGPTAAALATAGGSLIWAACVVGRSVRRRQRLEAELAETQARLAESRAMFQLALDTIPVRVFWKDREGRFLGCNRLVAQDAGREDPASLIGETDHQMSWRNEADLYRADDRLVMESGESRVRYDEPQTTPDGRTIWLRTSKQPLRDAQGRVIGVLGTYEDISGERQLRDRLRHAQKMEAVGQLAGGVAHDFNNMLQAIRGFVELALDDLPPQGDVRNHLIEVNHVADRAVALTRQLLTFGRRETLHPRPVDLNGLLRESLGMLRSAVGGRVEVSFTPQDALPAVNADRGQLELLFMNLCINARDAMPDGGGLRISTRSHAFSEAEVGARPWADLGQWVQLRVSDDGPGIPPELHERVFEPFFTTKPVGQGSGLGLASVYAIARQHGGMVELQSDDDGSTFVIHLPATDGMPEAREPGPQPTQPPGGDETLLLAEDDPKVRVLAERMLTSAGYEVVAVEDGLAAVSRFRADPERFDLLVLDVVMPRLGGWEAWQAIQELRPRFPVLFTSGYSFSGLDAAGLPDGECTLLPKPYGQADLLGAVRRLLDARQRRRAHEPTG